MAMSSHHFSIDQALAMYNRLRSRGHSNTLARLSVEARCGDMSPEERRKLRRLLTEKEEPKS
jgi:hypothetical protein